MHHWYRMNLQWRSSINCFSTIMTNSPTLLSRDCKVFVVIKTRKAQFLHMDQQLCCQGSQESNPMGVYSEASSFFVQWAYSPVNMYRNAALWHNPVGIICWWTLRSISVTSGLPAHKPFMTISHMEVRKFALTVLGHQISTGTCRLYKLCSGKNKGWDQARCGQEVAIGGSGMHEVLFLWFWCNTPTWNY